jgi:Flp pilus assembly protein TadD
MNATVYLFALTFALLSVMNPAQAADEGCGAAGFQVHPGVAATSVDGYLNEAHTMVTEKNWTGALAVTDEALAWHPDNPAFRCINGYALRKLGRYQEAVGQVSHAILFDQKPVRYANRGYSYLALGNFKAALSDADAGISRDAGFPASYAVKALALNAMGENSEALAAINRAIALVPQSAHYRHVQGRILAGGGNCTGARSAFERSLALDPGYDQPWPGFASAYEDLAILPGTCHP